MQAEAIDILRYLNEIMDPKLLNCDATRYLQLKLKVDIQKKDSNKYISNEKS